MKRSEGNSQRRERSSFATTHWSIVLAAARSQSPEAIGALEELCTKYWFPLYAYLRRSGYGPDEAADATQEFFAQRVATKRIFRGMNPGQGKFRTWLLNSLVNLVRNEWNRQHAKKRGGDRVQVSLDLTDGEGRYLIEPTHDLTPERIYERTWAMTLLEQAFTQLREKYERAGKSALFEELKGFLPGAQGQANYVQTAMRLKKSEAAVKMAVSRLRQEYGHALRAELKRTVSSPAEVQEELEHLLATLG